MVICMKKNNLLLHERILIYFRCRQDIKKNRIRFNQYPEKKGTVPVSPFVLSELSKFISSRDKMLKRRFWYKSQNDKGRIIYKWERFSIVLSELNDRIRVLNSDIVSIEKTYEAIVYELQKKYDSHLKHGDFSLARSNVRALHSKRIKLRKVKENMYRQLVALLSEKISIIENYNARINQVKEWRFLRVRLYYNTVADMEVHFPAYFYTEKDLFLICGNELNIEFTGELATAKADYKEVKEKMSFQNEPTIKELI